jgi:glutathione S-transferase
MITLTAFRSVPPFARGLVRDVRARWALAEAGIPYQGRLVGPEDLATPAYRALQPFGQVPAIETDELKLFELGAIVLHIAVKSEALMPSDANGRGADQSVDVRRVELGRTPGHGAGYARPSPRRRGVGGGPPADGGGDGAKAAYGT